MPTDHTQVEVSWVSPQARVPGNTFLTFAGILVPVLVFQLRFEPIGLPPRPLTPLYMYTAVLALIAWLPLRGRTSRLRAVCGGVLLPAGIVAYAIGVLLSPFVLMSAAMGLSVPFVWMFTILGLTPFAAGRAYWNVGRAELTLARRDRLAMTSFLAAAVASLALVVSLGRAIQSRADSAIEAIVDGREGASDGAIRTLAWLYRFPGVELRPLAWHASDSRLDDETRARLSDAWGAITGQPLPSD